MLKLHFYTIEDDADGAIFAYQDGFSCERDPHPDVIVRLGDPRPADDDPEDPDDDDYGFYCDLIGCANRLLFTWIATHESIADGLICILDWRKKMILHKIKDFHYNPPSNPFESFPNFMGMLVKQNKLVATVRTRCDLPANIQKPADIIRVWEFGDGPNQAFSLRMISEIRPGQDPDDNGYSAPAFSEFHG